MTTTEAGFKILYSPKVPYFLSSFPFVSFVTFFVKTSLIIEKDRKRKTKPSCGHLYHFLLQHPKTKVSITTEIAGCFLDFWLKLKKCKNSAKNIARWASSTFWGKADRKKLLFTSWNRRVEKWTNVLKKVHEEVRFLRVYNQPIVDES